MYGDSIERVILPLESIIAFQQATFGRQPVLADSPGLEAISGMQTKHNWWNWMDTHEWTE
jgi:hypothetical protein